MVATTSTPSTPSPPVREYPIVSVVVPVRNEAPRVARCLAAIVAQDYPADRLDVLVVDGRSTDDTREIVARIAREHPNVRLLDNPAARIPHGLNVGIRAARGDIIVRVDARASIGPHHVATCVATLTTTGAANVGGPIRYRGAGFWGRAIARAHASPFANPGTHLRNGAPVDVDSVYLGAFPRQTFERFGLFDERLPWNEDFELNYRIRRGRRRIIVMSALTVDHEVRASLPQVARQYWCYGRGKAKMLRLHPRSLALRHIAPPALVLAILAGLGLAGRGRVWPLAALVSAYTATVMAFAGWTTRGDGWSMTGAVGLAFACIHLSWGGGLLTEFLRQQAASIHRRFGR